MHEEHKEGGKRQLMTKEGQQQVPSVSRQQKNGNIYTGKGLLYRKKVWHIVFRKTKVSELPFSALLQCMRK